MFEGLCTSTGLVIIVLTLLAFGCPVQAIVQVHGLDKRTLASWCDRAGKQCQCVHIEALSVASSVAKLHDIDIEYTGAKKVIRKRTIGRQSNKGTSNSQE